MNSNSIADEVLLEKHYGVDSPEIQSTRAPYVKSGFDHIRFGFRKYDPKSFGCNLSKVAGSYITGCFSVLKTIHDEIPHHLPAGSALYVLEQLGIFAFAAAANDGMLAGVRHFDDISMSLVKKEQLRFKESKAVVYNRAVDIDNLVYAGMFIHEALIGKTRGSMRAHLAIDNDERNLSWLLQSENYFGEGHPNNGNGSSGGVSRKIPPSAFYVQNATYLLDFSLNGSVFAGR